MGSYAKVVNGIVSNVVKAEPEFFDTFVDSSPGKWIQCSYNTRGGVHYDPDTNEPDGGVALRYNYPSKGWEYDKERDAFIPPKFYDSWVLNEDTCQWESPVPHPEDFTGRNYTWNEEAQSWDAVETE